MPSAPQELDAIEAYGDAALHEKARIAVDKPDSDAIRITRLAWIAPNPQTLPFYDSIAARVRHLNAHFYHFDVTGPGESAIHALSRRRRRSL